MKRLPGMEVKTSIVIGPGCPECGRLKRQLQGMDLQVSYLEGRVERLTKELAEAKNKKENAA